MANGLHITLNSIELKEQLDALGYEFRYGANNLSVVAARAVNDTVSHMRSFTSKGMRSMYYVKKKDVDASLTTKKAHPRKIIAGRLFFQADKNRPLVSFGAKQGKNAVSVKILKSQRMRRIQAGGQQQILQTQKKKRAAVWLARGQILARSEKSDTPIMLWGPSFMAYFAKPGIAETLQTEAESWLQKRLEHQANFILHGTGKVRSGGKK